MGQWETKVSLALASAASPKCQGLTFNAIIAIQLTEESLPCFPSPQTNPFSKDFHTMLMIIRIMQEDPDLIPLAEQRQASCMATASTGAWERPFLAQFFLLSPLPSRYHLVGSLGGAAVWRLPLAQGTILET